LRLTGTLNPKLSGRWESRFFLKELFEQPLTASVGWDGKKIIVQQATAPNLKASGLIFAKVEGGAP